MSIHSVINSLGSDKFQGYQRKYCPGRYWGEFYESVNEERKNGRGKKLQRGVGRKGGKMEEEERKLVQEKEIDGEEETNKKKV